MSTTMFYGLSIFSTVVGCILLIVIGIALKERQLRRRTPQQRLADRDVLARYRALRADTERMASMK